MEPCPSFPIMITELICPRVDRLNETREALVVNSALEQARSNTRWNWRRREPKAARGAQDQEWSLGLFGVIK